MRTKIELNGDDMRKIIAEHFSVSEDKVTVSASEEWVGYGMQEHRESVPHAVVEKDS